MEEQLLNKIKLAIDKFINWLECYGETSQDHQDFFASPIGGRAKSLYYKSSLVGAIAVAPMIFCEAFVPSARRLFWRQQRLPIADAHYAMGFALLSQVLDNKKYYEKAVHFLNILCHTRSPGYQQFCWGYPFNWVTKNGTVIEGTPLITTTPYAYEAFKEVYQIDKKKKWLEIMHSIAEHAIHDIKDFETSHDASSCSYSPLPNDRGGVINASAYRAFLLTSASVHLSEDKYWQIAERNLNFVLQSQQPNGSWHYAADDIRDFVDHFHTCFVLKALVKIEQLTGHDGCKKAIENGIKYYVKELFDEKELPKPFSKAPRLTVYRQELYDYAESINLAVLLKNRFEELDKRLITVLNDLLTCWQKPDGSFRSRKLFLGWDNVPMHRWAQSQLFRSLCF
ncbi:MAG: hypothetical protein ACFFDN_25970, partial [Candidatus Hodarchaeota archaeon]